MGLDMYLSARLCTSEYTLPEAFKVLDTLELPGTTRPINSSDNFYSITIEYPVMYWRKANAIHNWFVQNCQGGVDDCRYADVSEEQLRELFMLVGGLLDAKNSKLSKAKLVKLVEEKLPPKGGSFFGGTKIDTNFWECLQDTHNVLAALVIGQFDTKKLVEWDFIYYSSW